MRKSTHASLFFLNFRFSSTIIPFVRKFIITTSESFEMNSSFYSALVIKDSQRFSHCFYEYEG